MRVKTSVLRSVVLLATLALATASAAGPPAGKVVRVGVLTALTLRFDPAANAWDRAIVDGLSEHGYVVGRNVIIEYRTAAGQPERLPELAAELVALKVDVIIAGPTAATLAA